MRTPEYVELDDSATDAIAYKTAALLGSLQPRRSILGDVPESGIVEKNGQRSPITGGLEAKYAAAGSTDAEIATNLYIADTILRSARRPSAGPVPRSDDEYQLSPRGQEVMIKAAELALRGPGPSIPETISYGGITKSVDPQGFVAKSYGAIRAEARTKALTATGGAGSGLDWVPTFATSELWRDFHLAANLTPQFRRFDMPTNPYTLPVETADVTFRYVTTENVAVTASTPTTASAALTARKIQAEVDFSGEVTEDSIIPIIPNLRFDLVRRGGQTMDDLCVNGDITTAATGNVNLDDATPAAQTFYLAFDGLRKFWNVTNTAQETNMAAAPTTTLLLAVRKLLGRYGAQPSNLILVTGATTYYALQSIAEVITLEKYGPSATIISGELARWFNIPVLINETTDKAKSNGRVSTTGSNNTLGWLGIVNTNMWRVGFRRDLQIESFRDIQKDQNILVASFRMAFIPSGITTAHTAGARNVTV